MSVPEFPAETSKAFRIVAAVPVVGVATNRFGRDTKLPVHGPGKVSMEFNINGKNYKAELATARHPEAFDALRDQFELTGSKTLRIARSRHAMVFLTATVFVRTLAIKARK